MIVLTHGMSIYPNLLSHETAEKLIDCIDKMGNYHALKSNVQPMYKNRWSFGIGTTENPIIAVAWTKKVTNSTLCPALDQMHLFSNNCNNYCIYS